MFCRKLNTNNYFFDSFFLTILCQRVYRAVLCVARQNFFVIVWFESKDRTDATAMEDVDCYIKLKTETETQL